MIFITLLVRAFIYEEGLIHNLMLIEIYSLIHFVLEVLLLLNIKTFILALIVFNKTIKNYVRIYFMRGLIYLLAVKVIYLFNSHIVDDIGLLSLIPAVHHGNINIEKLLICLSEVLRFNDWIVMDVC